MQLMTDPKKSIDGLQMVTEKKKDITVEITEDDYSTLGDFNKTRRSIAKSSQTKKNSIFSLIDQQKPVTTTTSMNNVITEEASSENTTLVRLTTAGVPLMNLKASGKLATWC